MKKQLLLILSSVVLLGISCTDKQSEKSAVSDIQKTVVTQVKSTSQIDHNVKLTTSSKSVLSEKSKKTTAIVVATNNELTKIDLIRKKHETFLNNSPFKKVMALNKKERKAMGIPPNKFYEQEWELSMNPETGRPNPENLDLIRNELIAKRKLALASGRTPGDGTDNNWVERGPNNVGGRVRAVMFDPNDPTFKTVFAGGVSGGLWKNTDITSATSTWARVNIPENLAVSVITVDPTNSNVFYVGTGESYVGGDVNGDGVWKSTNGGTTWTKIFGGITGPTTFQTAANLTINSPAGVAGNYECIPTTAFGSPVSTPITANIVLVIDDTAPTSDGCETITNASALSGNIALIRRGTCTFVFKVKAAQDAGAIGVIIMNDNRPITGLGDDGTGVGATITIPSIMISELDGNTIEAAVTAGTVSGTLNPVVPGAFTGNLVPGKQHINDIKVRNNGGVPEIYVAAGDSFYGAANATTYLGGPGYGLFKSVNGGSSWTEVSLPLTANGNRHCPNDIAIAADNKIWVSTTNSVVYGDGGGKIFSSTDGTNFTLAYTVASGDRTQIAVSSTTANKVYVLAELSTAAAVGLYKTTNGFTTTATLVLPADADSGVGPDFTRGQAFYDLMLEVDPNNDQIVYTGGIDLFKSTDGGASWNQFSHWYGSFGFQEVHADQHGMAFAPGSSTRMIFGNDGGVYYSNNGGSLTEARNNGLNVTQFYSVGVAPTSLVSGLTGNDYFAAGAQDNGTQYFENASPGINSSDETQGGDGAFTMFDQGADNYYISNYVYNNNINYTTITGDRRNINNESLNNGAFIAPMALDSNLDILYSDYSNSTPAYQIRRYKNIKAGTIQKKLLSNALLTSSPTAISVSKYTTATSKLLVGTRLGKLLSVIVENPSTNTTPASTWADITGPSFVGSISDVEFGASESEIFVTMHNYNVVSVWYSSDAGVTWQNKEGNLPDLPVKCILRNPLNANEVIIGTELGVWYTNNFNASSPTWNPSYNGMSNVKVVDLDVRNDNTVFAATYGRGIFSGQFTQPSLSTNDNVLNKGIKVYPNPSNGIVNVSIDNYAGNITVEVYDINGRKVFSNAGDYMKANTINLQGFQKGVYILNVKGDELSYSEKIILQ
ncbi:MAG: T9SS type A sorting domain-containing protein [Flavobacterium sp.]|nr:T9SS type A sorting domain-containing protein [Flavobacterium sp.]